MNAIVLCIDEKSQIQAKMARPSGEQVDYVAFYADRVLLDESR